MARIKKIDKLLLNCDYLHYKAGSGDFGICYYYNDNLIVKILHNKEYSYLVEAAAKKFCGIESETYIFPKILIYDKKSFYGYITDLVKGIELVRNGRKILLKDLVESLDLAYEETYKISKKRIKTADVASQNMMLDENHNLKIIDTDLYEKKTIGNISTIYEHNLSELNIGILLYLLGLDRYIYPPDYVYNEFKKLKKLFNFDITRFIKTTAIKQLLSEIDKCVSDEKGDFCTIKEANHYIRKRYRKLM